MSIIRWPRSAYRRLLAPDEIAARREAEARGQVAKVIQMSGGPNDLQPASPRDVPVDRTDEEALNRLARKGLKLKILR